jgi:putative peptidoglycan lipid II flippase
MENTLSKRSILKKTIEVGSSTLVSRIFGIAREGLQALYMGVGTSSDVFLTAFRIPSVLRKIFAEGALSAAFVPTLVKVVRQQGKDEANKLMSLAFLVFEGVVLILCAIAMWHAEPVIRFMAPGFSPEKIALAVPLLHILIPFIFFVSSSALLAGALQAVGHFFVPAFSPVLLNIFYIAGLAFCWVFNVSITYLCFFILLGGFVQLLGHILAYKRLGFSFGFIDSFVMHKFGAVLTNFFLCSISMSIMEINLLIDSRFASYLADGSMTLLYYANRFMGIPFGIFAVAFSTILLPHFSRITAYAPKRLSFYLLETTKLVLWVTVPVALVMGFLSEKIFYTVFLSAKFNMAHVVEAGHILVAFLIGLFFFSLNKILLNMYYALHVSWIPAIISVVATLVNYGLNMLLVGSLQATGLALATTISGIAQTLLFIIFLRYYFNFTFYGASFLQFFVRYVVQMSLICFSVGCIYYGIELLIGLYASVALKQFLLYGLGFWLWVAPLSIALFALLFYTRKLFKVDLYFLD